MTTRLALVYARVSTEEQATKGYSLEEQVEACQKRARELGASETIVIKDEGVTASILERPGLTKARELVKKGHVGLFVCYDPDRFARNLSHQLLVTEEIEKAGVRLEFVNFEWKNTPEGKLFYSLRGAIAEYEKEKIRQRTMAGKRAKARKGKLTHNPGTYGYDYVPGESTFEVNTTEAAVVRQIFQWAAEGHGMRAIADMLNDRGIPSPKGKQWAKGTVSRICRNQTYTGVLHLNQYNSEGMKANRYRPENERLSTSIRPKDQWIPIDVPRIIDDVLWRRVQEQRRRAKRLHPGTSKANYLLSGLCRCGLCGYTIHGFLTRPKGKMRRYYVCTTRNPGIRDVPKCEQPYHPADGLEKAVWKQVASWIRNPESLQEALRGQNEAADAPSKLARDEKQMLEDTLAKATKERARLLDVLQKGLVPAHEIEERLAQLKARTDKAEQRLAELTNAEENLPSVPSPDLDEALRVIKEQLRHASFETRQKAVRSLVDSVLVFPEELVVRARVPKELMPPNGMMDRQS